MVRKKIVSLIVALCILMGTATVFAGCAPDDNSEAIDPSRTQLYIGISEGGWGTDYMYAVKQGFEKLYPEIQVYIDLKSSEYTNNVLYSSIQNYRQDVYILGEGNWGDFWESKLIADVTDVVKEPVYTAIRDYARDGEQKVYSIEDKINDSLIKSFQDKNGRFFGIPFQSVLYGFVYDADLFEEENLYDNKNGPDGIDNTFDDGLPSTYEDFKNLLNVMVRKGLTPYTLSGATGYYAKALVNNIQALYEGENWELNYSFDGVHTELGKIDYSNGYRLGESNSRRVALQVAKDLVSNPKYHSKNAFKSTQTHIQAQDEFLMSVLGEDRIAMIVEAGWWENEARDTFSEMANIYDKKYGYGERNFKFLPWPNFDGQSKGSGITYLANTYASMAFINAASSKKDIAGKFLQYLVSEEMLRSTNKILGATLAYDYELTDADLSEMSTYAKSIYDICRNENINITYDFGKYPTYDFYRNNLSYLTGVTGFKSVVGTNTFDNPLKDFYSDRNLTVETYYEGLRFNNTAENWDKNIDWESYFN